MGYAFISYSSKHQASADAIRELFNKNKIDTWMAPYDIPAGSSYMGEINRALAGCSCLVLVLSDAAQNSQWVLREVERALSYKKTIIPVKIEDVVLNDEFDFALGSCHVVAIQKIDESLDEVKNVLNSVRACTKDDDSDIDNTIVIKAGELNIAKMIKENFNAAIANSYNNAGVLCAEQGLLEKSEAYLKKAIEIREQHCGTIETENINNPVVLNTEQSSDTAFEGIEDLTKEENKKSRNIVVEAVEELDFYEDKKLIGKLALCIDDVLVTKKYKQHFSNSIVARMPDNEKLEFELVEYPGLDYTIAFRRVDSVSVVFSVLKKSENASELPVVILDGKRFKKIYRAFINKHKDEYIFTDEIEMQPKIQPRKIEEPRGFTEKTAFGMFGPYLKPHIEIPSIYAFIGSHVFTHAERKVISTLAIPGSVTKIEDFAFSDVAVEKFIIVPESVTEIGISAFKLTKEGFIECSADSYAYKYARKNGLRNSVDIVNEHKANGVCAYCGGTFTGLFKKKCSQCGREKSYSSKEAVNNESKYSSTILTDSSDFFIGKRLDGRYEINKLIGQDEKSFTYEAFDTIDYRTVAVKIFNSDYFSLKYLENARLKRSVENTFKAISVLSHKNIAKVFDFSVGDKFQYIVMEYIDGITLEEYIRKQKKVDWKKALVFVSQILEALNYAHNKGVLHGNINLKNIIVLPNDIIKVIDFGVPGFKYGDSGNVMADLCFVGLVLYKMLTGKVLLQGKGIDSVALMQILQEIDMCRKYNPTITVDVERIIIRAVQKNPDDGYKTASEMLTDIKAAE